MRVIGTINDSVSKTGRTTYAHCPLPVGEIECDRRHNLVVICLKWKIHVVSFNITYAIDIFVAWIKKLCQMHKFPRYC